MILKSHSIDLYGLSMKGLVRRGYAPYFARLRHLGFDVLFEHIRIAEWSERVAKMPSVVEGVERWFNPKYLALFAEKRPEVIARISRLAGSLLSGCGTKCGHRAYDHYRMGSGLGVKRASSV